MILLNRIELKGFKSIREMELDLKSLNILIGANGSGKSNLLSFFKLLNFITSKNLQEHVAKYGGADKLLHYGAKRTPQMEGTLYFSTDMGSNLYHMILTKASGDTLIFTDEQVCLQRSHNNSERFSFAGHRETLLKEDNDNTVRMILDIMEQFRFYQFHDTSENAKIKQNAYVNDNLYLRSDAGNLAAYLYLLKNKHESHYRKIIATIHQIAPFFDDFILRPLKSNENYINLDWNEKGSDMIFDVNQLSDGTLRMMALITLLLQPELPHLMIIDEPELGLHPYAINILASLLKGASVRTQLIVSTQSVSLVNNFEPEDLIIVNRMEGQSTFKRVDKSKLEEWLDEYTLGELWEKNVIGGRPSI